MRGKGKGLMVDEARIQVDTAFGPVVVTLPPTLGKAASPSLMAVVRERLRQDELVRAGKFSWNCAFDGPTYSEKLAVLMEEVGEVAREVTEHIITRDKYAADEKLRVMPEHREEHFRERLKKELVQVAAVCVAWIEAIDRDLDKLDTLGWKRVDETDLGQPPTGGEAA